MRCGVFLELAPEIPRRVYPCSLPRHRTWACDNGQTQIEISNFFQLIRSPVTMTRQSNTCILRCFYTFLHDFPWCQNFKKRIFLLFLQCFFHFQFFKMSNMLSLRGGFDICLKKLTVGSMLPDSVLTKFCMCLVQCPCCLYTYREFPKNYNDPLRY